MPLSSGAHGWSLTYINKPPPPRKSPGHYFYTAEIPHSHKRYRTNTIEDNMPSVGTVGQPKTRRPQWYPVNNHRFLEPDPFNFTHSSLEGKLNQRKNNDFRFESSPDTRRKTFPPLRQQGTTTGPIRAEERQFDEDSSNQNQTLTGNSFTSGHRRVPPPVRRKLVYPVSKFKEVKLVQKDDDESRVSKPLEQSVLTQETPACSTIPNIMDSHSNSIGTENDKKTDDIETSHVQHSNIIAHSIANSIINEKDEKTVTIPSHPLRGSESSQTLSPARSHGDTKRQETDLESSCESLSNVKNAPDNNINKDNPKQEASVSVKGSNANYLTNNTTNNAQNNSSRVKKSDQETEGSGGKKKKTDQIEHKAIQKNKDVIVVKPSRRETSVDTRENNDRVAESKSRKTEESETKHTIIPIDKADSCKDQVIQLSLLLIITF